MWAITAGFFFRLACVPLPGEECAGRRFGLPAIPGALGPPYEDPARETPPVSDRPHDPAYAPPARHRDAAAAHPADCRTEGWRLSVLATVPPSVAIPRSPHSPVALPAASVVAAGARLAGTSTHRHRRSAVAQFVVAGKDAAAALSPRRAGVLLTRSP